MRDRLFNLIHPGNAACIATLLVAVGLEVDQVLLKHILDIIAALVAIAGFFTPNVPPPPPSP